MAGVLKHDSPCGCTRVPVAKAPPISVPPQYSSTGAWYAARDMSQSASDGVEASPVEEKALQQRNTVQGGTGEAIQQCLRASNTVQVWNTTGGCKSLLHVGRRVQMMWQKNR